MKKTIALLLLCVPIAAVAADAPRKPFPDDYTPTTCPGVSCKSYEEGEMQSAAVSFMGFSLDIAWLHQHLPLLMPEFDKLCTKLTSCFATPPNNKLFCLDVMTSEFMNICDRKYPKSASATDWSACSEIVSTYLLGLDQRMQPRF